jgi:6-phosphogluconolactonase
MGADGHTASLFSGTAALREQMRLVTANWVEKFNASRITLTPPILDNAACSLDTRIRHPSFFIVLDSFNYAR